MKCERCGKAFKDRDMLIPVVRYVVNENRGDFVHNQPSNYIHLKCA